MTAPQLIALIDDDEAFREAMVDLLDSAGIESISFESAEDFLCDARKSAATCIVLDINLSGMSGLELQHALCVAACPTPILFLTSVDDPYVRERATTGGAGGFLTKPVDSAALLHWIRVLNTHPKGS